MHCPSAVRCTTVPLVLAQPVQADYDPSVAACLCTTQALHPTGSSRLLLETARSWCCVALQTRHVCAALHAAPNPTVGRCASQKAQKDDALPGR